MKGALALDAAILLGAGADARRRWRLVVIVVHALRNVKRGMADFWEILSRSLSEPQIPQIPQMGCDAPPPFCRLAPHPRFKPGAGSDPLPSRERGYFAPAIGRPLRAGDHKGRPLQLRLRCATGTAFSGIADLVLAVLAVVCGSSGYSS